MWFTTCCAVPWLQITHDRIDFFPLLVALALESEEDETAQQLQELKSMVSIVLDRFKEEVRMSTHHTNDFSMQVRTKMKANTPTYTILFFSAACGTPTHIKIILESFAQHH